MVASVNGWTGASVNRSTGADVSSVADSIGRSASGTGAAGTASCGEKSCSLKVYRIARRCYTQGLTSTRAVGPSPFREMNLFPGSCLTEDVSMMRCARVAPLWLVMLLFARGVSAQTPAPAAQSSDEETPFYAAVDAAATFGHKSAGAFGGELGYHIH